MAEGLQEHLKRAYEVGGASIRVLQERIRLMEEMLGKLEHIDANGCISGDCPHDHANQCVITLSEELKFVAKTVRKALKK